MQRVKRGLGEQPRRHQRQRRPGGGFGANAARQHGDVEGAVGAVQQHGAKQVQSRAEQREQQIAQRRRERVGTPVKADERHRGEGEQFEGDKQIEQVSAEKDRVQPSPHAQQQRPEDERRPRFRVTMRRELRAREQPDAGDQQRRGDQHHRGKTVCAQRDAQRRVPAADDVLRYLVRPPNPGRDRHRERETERHHDQRHAAGVAAGEQ